MVENSIQLYSSLLGRSKILAGLCRSVGAARRFTARREEIPGQRERKMFRALRRSIAAKILQEMQLGREIESTTFGCTSERCWSMDSQTCLAAFDGGIWLTWRNSRT